MDRLDRLDPSLRLLLLLRLLPRKRLSKCGWSARVQEFSGAFTLLDASSVDGATIETPHPSSMISPTSYSNIPTNYSYSALFRYQPCLDTHTLTHSLTHHTHRQIQQQIARHKRLVA